MKVLFLCSELAGYFANCIQLLHRESEADITVVYWPNSESAPFENILSGIQMINKFGLSKRELFSSCVLLKPTILYVAGWVDDDYKKIARKLKREGTIVVGGLDNQWNGSLRQRTACLLSNLLVKPYYTYLWVAGHRQYQFARKLGYSYDRIITGLYAADIEKFKSIVNNTREKYLVFVGRFEESKGVRLLYNVFSGLSTAERNGWRLKMIGNGNLKPQLSSNQEIEIVDFLQPDELVNFVSDAGGFILPSLHEPWGVVVQEFAAAGLPIILSSNVNSGEAFLIHNFNGFKFQSGDANNLKEILKHFFHLEDEVRKSMGMRSSELASKSEPKYWVANFLSLISRSVLDSKLNT